MTATEFTPVAALLGGALIGIAAVALMAATGRIAGISGIAVRLLPPYTEAGLGACLIMAADIFFHVDPSKVSGACPPFVYTVAL
jgi:hypothetical protein